MAIVNWPLGKYPVTFESIHICFTAENAFKRVEWRCHKSVMASEVINNSTVCSTGVFDVHKKKIKIPHHWPFVRAIHRSPVDSPHKGPVMRKCFTCHDVIMYLNVSICYLCKRPQNLLNQIDTCHRAWWLARAAFSLLQPASHANQFCPAPPLPWFSRNMAGHTAF